MFGTSLAVQVTAAQHQPLILHPGLAMTREVTFSFRPHSIAYKRLPMGDELHLIFQFFVFSALYELLCP